MESLRIHAALTNLSAIREFVQSAVEAPGVPERVVDHVVLATDEWATNIIRHGYGGGAGEIEVDVERTAAEVVVRVRDHAPPFDPTAVPAPDLTLPLEERPIGGLGIHLMRETMDDLSYRRLPDGNEVTLVKRLNGAGTNPPEASL